MSSFLEEVIQLFIETRKGKGGAENRIENNRIENVGDIARRLSGEVMDRWGSYGTILFLILILISILLLLHSGLVI